MSGMCIRARSPRWSKAAGVWSTYNDPVIFAEYAMGIVRDGYQITEYKLTPNGTCPHCATALAGRFGEFMGQFGRRRIPVALGTS